MGYRIAHLSDVHLAPLPFSEVMQDFALKRLVGGISWHRYRKFLHLREVADATRAAIKNAQPDHVCFTGDLVNICTKGEMARGLEWLQEFGTPDQLTLVPGNHDAYVRKISNNGLAQWGQYFDSKGSKTPFPCVRLRKNIAIIGLSTAIPQPLHRACGQLGQRQLKELAAALTHYGTGGFYRVVLIHHPPLPGQAHRVRDLHDAAAMREVLHSCGAELVLHGHNHKHMHEVMETPQGRIQIFGLPSASMTSGKSFDAAAWAMFEIERKARHWHTAVTVHGLADDALRFDEVRKFEFESGVVTHAERT